MIKTFVVTIFLCIISILGMDSVNASEMTDNGTWVAIQEVTPNGVYFRMDVTDNATFDKSFLLSTKPTWSVYDNANNQNSDGADLWADGIPAVQTQSFSEYFGATSPTREQLLIFTGGADFIIKQRISGAPVSEVNKIVTNGIIFSSGGIHRTYYDVLPDFDYEVGVATVPYDSTRNGQTYNGTVLYVEPAPLAGILTSFNNYLSGLINSLFENIPDWLAQLLMVFGGILALSLVLGIISSIVDPPNMSRDYDDFLFKR